MRLPAEGFKTLLQALHNERRKPKMQGTAHQSGGIRTFGQIIAQPTIHKVGHALCRCGLPHVALLPAEPFYMFLKAHHAQGIIASFGKGLLTILRFHLHHHATVAPCCAAVAGTHAVHHNLLFVGGGRNNKTARTHAETIDATALRLGHKRIFGCRKIAATTIFVVILNLVDKLAGVLQTHAHGYAFGFDFDVGIVQIAVDIACAVARSQNHRSAKRALCVVLQVMSFHAHHFVTLY